MFGAAAYNRERRVNGKCRTGDILIMTNFAILGAGAWGTAIGLVLARNPAQHVRLWSARANNGLLLQERRENIRLLPGVPIPASICLTTDLGEALASADLAVAAIPTVFLRKALKGIAAAVPLE